MKSHPVSRRRFLRQAATAGAGLLILPSGALAGKKSPGNRLNIALIGAWGRAKAHYEGLRTENVVAICDVNEHHLGFAAREFPGAKTYRDWRRCLEQKDIEAVLVCTPDHTHAHIASWTLNRDYHLYLEKPLGICVHESRYLREKWAGKRHKLATQVGTQRHAKPNFSRVRELVRDGAIGDLTEVHAWGDRELRAKGYPKDGGPAPAHIDWDLWLGPSPYHPYSPEYWKYYPDTPGMNCLAWNMYWDFGTGQVGDMGSHTMDLVWNALDATLPESAEAEGEAYNPEVTPVDLRASFQLPANDWRGPVRVTWWQGAMKPKSPSRYISIAGIDHGAMFRGSRGYLLCDFDTRVVVPYGDQADMTYFQPRPARKVTPPAAEFQREWIDACKGDLRTSCDFDYNGRMMEMMYLGLVAYRAGRKVTYDGATGTIVGDAEAGALLRRPYREGWPIDG